MAQPAHILTANRLRDGEVVYWRAGAWVEALAEAEVFADKAGAQDALKAAAAFVADRTVVTPYVFDVRPEGTGWLPVKERERIRAAGPTVRLDLGKQGARHVSL